MVANLALRSAAPCWRPAYPWRSINKQGCSPAAVAGSVRGQERVYDGCLSSSHDHLGMLCSPQRPAACASEPQLSQRVKLTSSATQRASASHTSSRLAWQPLFIDVEYVHLARRASEAGDMHQDVSSAAPGCPSVGDVNGITSRQGKQLAIGSKRGKAGKVKAGSLSPPAMQATSVPGQVAVLDADGSVLLNVYCIAPELEHLVKLPSNTTTDSTTPVSHPHAVAPVPPTPRNVALQEPTSTSPWLVTQPSMPDATNVSVQLPAAAPNGAEEAQAASQQGPLGGGDGSVSTIRQQQQKQQDWQLQNVQQLDQGQPQYRVVGGVRLSKLRSSTAVPLAAVRCDLIRLLTGRLVVGHGIAKDLMALGLLRQPLTTASSTKRTNSRANYGTSSGTRSMDSADGMSMGISRHDGLLPKHAISFQLPAPSCSIDSSGSGGASGGVDDSSDGGGVRGSSGMAGGAGCMSAYYDTMSFPGFQGQSRAKATSHDKKANSTAALSSAALGVRGGVNSGGAQSLKQLAHRFLDGRVIQAHGGAHDALEDACAVADLYMRYVQHSHLLDTSYDSLVDHLTAQITARIVEAQARAVVEAEEAEEEYEADLQDEMEST